MPSRPGTEPQEGLPVQWEKWVPPSTICAPLGFLRRPKLELTALSRLAVMPEMGARAGGKQHRFGP